MVCDNRRKNVEHMVGSQTETLSVWEPLAILADRLIQRSELYYTHEYPYSVKDALSWVRQAIDIRETLLQEAKIMLTVEESAAGEEWERRVLSMQRTLPFAYGLCGDMCRHQQEYEEAVTWYRKALAAWSMEPMDITRQAEKLLFLYVKYIDCWRRTPVAETKEGRMEEKELIRKARRLKEELRSRMGTRKCLQMFYDWEGGLWECFDKDEESLREVAGQLYGIYLWNSDVPGDWRMMQEIEGQFPGNMCSEGEEWLYDDWQECKYLRALKPWRLSGGSGEELSLRPMGWLEWSGSEYVAAISWDKKWTGEPNREKTTFWKIGDSDVEEYALRAEKVTDQELCSALEQQYRECYSDGFLAKPVQTRQLIDFRKWDPLTEKKKVVMRNVAKVFFNDLSYDSLCDLNLVGYVGFGQGAYARTTTYRFCL